MRNLNINKSKNIKFYKIQNLVKSLNLKNVKSFKNNEEYLEYVIQEINNTNIYEFYQFLFLIDALYVAVDILEYPKPQPFRPEEEIRDHYKEHYMRERYYPGHEYEVQFQKETEKLDNLEKNNKADLEVINKTDLSESLSEAKLESLDTSKHLKKVTLNWKK